MENYIIGLYILILLFLLFLGLNFVINMYIKLVYWGVNQIGKVLNQSQYPHHVSGQRARKFRKL